MRLHFIRPEWLLALVPLALLLAWLWKTKGQRSAWQSYIAPHLTLVLLTPGGKQRPHRLTLLTMIWLLGTLALAGPAVNKQPLPVFSSDQGRVIVLDMSKSLYATDLAPNRLTQEKFRATDLLNGLKDGETALVAYAGDAFTISPMTTDRQTLLNLLPTLNPDIMPVQGSNPDSAISLAKQLLAQSGHRQGDIILLTDGISPGQYDDSLSQLKGSNYRLAVLAMGTAQGAPIRLPDGQLQRDNAGEVVVAKTDFGLLGRLATATGGIMVPFNPDGSGVPALLTWLDKGADQAKDTGIKGEQWQDLGPYLALLLLLPVLYSFRSGILACISLLVISQPQPAHAANWWQDLWQTPNQQGQSAFDSQAYQNAANLFEDSNWRGSAHYKAGDYEKALAEFQRDESAIGQFNQGNARMQMGQLDEAIANYEAALKQNPDFADA
ncbi:MAG: VWA domain-containing protein, partial [Shewanella sp.]|nr:VWA domain-containing protein [Shewanella sp.]